MKRGLMIFLVGMLFSLGLVSAGSFGINYSSVGARQNLTLDNSINYLSSVDSGLQLYLPFEIYNSSSIFDVSGNSYDGSYVNNAVISSVGPFNHSLSLDGVDDKVTVSSLPVAISNLTVCAWFKLNNYDTNGATIIDRRNGANPGFYILVASNGIMQFLVQNQTIVGNTNCKSSAAISLGVWNHVCGVYNGTNVMIYWNGNLNSTQLQTGNISSSQTFTIGMLGTVAGYDFNGSIDEVMVYTNPLNSTQISQIYNNQSSRFYNSGVWASNFLDNSNLEFVNVSLANYSRELGSNISVRLGQFNGSYNYSSENSLVGHFSFDSNFNDSSGKLSSTNYGISLSSGHLSNSSYFDGTQANGISVDSNYLLNSSQNMTFMVWIYPKTYGTYSNGVDGYGKILDKFQGGFSSYQMTLNNNSSSCNKRAVCFYDGSNTFSSAQDSIVLNQWQHVAVVYNSTSVRFYINGVLSNNYTGSYTLLQNAKPLWIGRNFDVSLNTWFNGKMDDLMIFNRSLSSSEVNNYMSYSFAVINYTDWQNVSAKYSGDNESLNNFSLVNNTLNFLTEIKLISSNNFFLAPLVNSSINFVLNSLDVIAPTIAVSSPINNGAYNSNVISLNVSSDSSDVQTWQYRLQTNNASGIPKFYSIGDSITNGYAPTYTNQSFSNYIAARTNAPIENEGISGNTCNQVISRFNTDVGSDANYVVLGCGINDLGTQEYADPGANVTNELTTLYNMTMAKGAKLIVWTMLPYKNGSFWDGGSGGVITCQEILDINSFILNNMSKWENVSVVDIYNNFTNGTRCWQNSSLFYDGIHPNWNGTIILGEGIWGQALNYTTYWNNDSGNISFSPNSTIRLPIGSYNLTIYDTDNKLNSNSSGIISFNIENVSPNVTLVSPVDDYSETSSSASIDFKFNVSDDSDIANCSLYVNGANYSNSSSVNKSLTNTISVSGITPGSYDWYVRCYDAAGNFGNSSNNSFVVDAPVVATSTGGGSVYYPTDSNINLGYSQKLFSGARVKFNLNGEIHQLRLNSLSSDFVNVTISSNPQTFSLRVGESKKLDLNDDSVYDLRVSLNSIVANLANLTIIKINESMIISAPENKTFVGINKSENKKVEEAPESGEKNNVFGVVVIIIVVLFVIAALVLFFKERKKRFYWKINVKHVSSFY